MGQGDYVFNIRQVIELTGISEFLLRTWELRYKNLKPIRTETGRRLYNQSQVLRISKLVELTKRGYRVGKIADLSDPKLQDLINSDSKSSIQRGASHPSTPQFQKLIKNCDSFKWDEVAHSIKAEAKSSDPIDFIFKFTLPLISEMNVLIEQNKFTISQEHIVSCYLKQELYSLISQQKRPLPQRGRIVFAAPEGDIHEIGLLIAAAITSWHRANILFLGPNVPRFDLCDSCIKFNATHLVLTSTVGTENGAKEDLLSYLSFIDRNLPKSIRLVLGGLNVRDKQIRLSRDFEILESLSQLKPYLERKGKKI